MRYQDTISLLKSTVADNDIGDSVPVKTSRTVYANKKSIRQSEFYQAATTGLRPQCMFEIRTVEYQNEDELIYDGETLRIIRTYDKGEYIELIAGGIVSETVR